MKKILISALMISIITVSCKNEEEEVIAPQTTEVDSSVFLESLNSSNTTEASATSTQNVADGINPPHGQPGHRCEIAVGAPLNSSPDNAKQAAPTSINNVTPVPASTPKQTMVPSNTVSNATPAGMNPPHGQEGHICSIGVGEPLPKK